MSHTNKKWAFLIVLFIAGALIVSYGFNRIDNQQHTQNSLIEVRETQKAACHAANVLRAQSNLNGYAEYRAWVTYSQSITAKPLSLAAQKALKPVLNQTWIPLTDCQIPPKYRVEGYPIPSAVKFSVQPPPPAALTVLPEDS